MEAKQHLTAKKVKDKIRQRTSIIKLLESNTRLAKFYLDKFDRNVGLYLGGQEVDDGARKDIDDFVQANQNTELSGFIELNGSRFSVKDLSNSYGEFSVNEGGGKSKARSFTRNE